ncbi:unnamed protein product, partial [Rotaria sp. Silwood1]
SELRCQSSGSCVINIHTRRHCAYCRLQKCFDVEMRKELILSDEEKKSRHLLILANRQLKQILSNKQPLLTLSTALRKRKRSLISSRNEQTVVNSVTKMHCCSSNDILNDEDRILLNNINNAYQLVVDKNDYSYIDKYTSSTPFSQFINDETIMYESLINFFKCIPEFKQLDKNDQILLIKSNLLTIIHLHHIIIYNFQDCPNLDKCLSKWINKDFDYQIVRTRQYFYRFINHPLVLKLALVVLIFSVNLSSWFDITQFYEYKNMKILFEYQNYYTNILWRYLNYLFDEKEAIKVMEIIVMQILRFQLLMVTMRNSVCQSPYCSQYHPLMQSVLGL